MFLRYFSGEITNWPRLPCYNLDCHRIFSLFAPVSRGATTSSSGDHAESVQRSKRSRKLTCKADDRMIFEEVTPPPFRLVQELDVEPLAVYMGTWSSSQRYRKETDRDPIGEIRGELAA